MPIICCTAAVSYHVYVLVQNISNVSQYQQSETVILLYIRRIYIYISQPAMYNMYEKNDPYVFHGTAVSIDVCDKDTCNIYRPSVHRLADRLCPMDFCLLYIEPETLRILNYINNKQQCKTRYFTCYKAPDSSDCCCNGTECVTTAAAAYIYVS